MSAASDTRLVDIGMPRLSDSMEEATILSWLKRPGDDVARGEPLVEVETDKATMVYEAETAGVLEEIVVDDGATATLGAVIARIRVRGTGGAASAGPAPTAATPAPARRAGAGPTAEVEFREAVRQALDEELARDERVFLFGEDVAAAGGVFAVTPGLHEKYGPDRVFDTPISELAMTGAAYGAAITGKRPVLEIMFGDFLALSMDTLINQASKYWFLTGGTQSVPLVIRSVVGAGGRFGAIHSQMPVSWLTGITGLKIVAPATPADAKGLLKAAIRDENPVVFLEHKGRHRRGGGRPAHPAPARPRDRPRLGGEDEPGRSRGGGPSHRRMGGGDARPDRRARPQRPRRRLADRHAGHADPVQPAARGRPSARAGADRRRGPAPGALDG